MAEHEDNRQEMAEDRTNWAYRRTLLAKERTFSAWIRTGLATVVVGFAVVRLLEELQPTWLTKVLGGLFITTGGAIFLVGYWSYRQTLKELARKDIRALPGWVMTVITAALVLGAVAGIALLL